MRLFGLSLLICTALAQNATNGSEIGSESEAAAVGRSLAESAAFAIVTLVISIGFIVKGYFDTVYELAEAWPRTVAVVYLLSAWAFALFVGGLAVLVGPTDGVTLTPASLWYASTSLAIGPFFVFTPIRPILLAKRSVLRAAATFARKESTRKSTFALFVLLTGLQALVAFDMYTLLDSFGLPFEQVLLTVFGYSLTAVFYLIVFYSSLLGRVFTIKNLDMVDHLRKNAFVHFRERLHLLSGRFYAHCYVGMFLILVAAEGVLGYLIVRDSHDFRTGSKLRYALFIAFLVAVGLFVIASIIFVLVAAFRPIKLRLAGEADDSDDLTSSSSSSSVTAAVRDVKALHVATGTSVRWCRFAAHLTPTQRASITEDIVALLPSLSTDASATSTHSVREGRVFQSNPQDDLLHLLTAGRGLPADEAEEWLGFFDWEVRGQRVDGASAAALPATVGAAYDAVFQRLVAAFDVPAEWARVREDVLVAQGETEAATSAFAAGELAPDAEEDKKQEHASPPAPVRGGKRSDSPGGASPGGAAGRRSRRRTQRLSRSADAQDSGSDYDARTMDLERGTIVVRDRDHDTERERGSSAKRKKKAAPSTSGEYGQVRLRQLTGGRDNSRGGGGGGGGDDGDGDTGRAAGKGGPGRIAETRQRSDTNYDIVPVSKMEEQAASVQFGGAGRGGGAGGRGRGGGRGDGPGPVGGEYGPAPILTSSATSTLAGLQTSSAANEAMYESPASMLAPADEAVNYDILPPDKAYGKVPSGAAAKSTLPPPALGGGGGGGGGGGDGDGASAGEGTPRSADAGSLNLSTRIFQIMDDLETTQAAQESTIAEAASESSLSTSGRSLNDSSHGGGDPSGGSSLASSPSSSARALNPLRRFSAGRRNSVSGDIGAEMAAAAGVVGGLADSMSNLGASTGSPQSARDRSASRGDEVSPNTRADHARMLAGRTRSGSVGARGTGALASSGNVASAQPSVGDAVAEGDAERLYVALAPSIMLAEMLGKGGSCTEVYRATSRGLTFAVKVFDTTYITKAEVESINREIELMQRFRHDNIVTYLFHFVPNDAPREIWLCMEYFATPTLYDVIVKRRAASESLQPTEMTEYCMQIARGLRYLHSALDAPVIHRDLKSENVFFARDARTSRVVLKIGDFGESVMGTKAYFGWRRKILKGANVGTAEFRAPELHREKAEGASPYTEKVDIWSFGMVLFEMLTLDIPYRQENLSRFDIPKHIRRGIRPTMSPLDAAGDRAPLVDVFKRCTELDVTVRPTARDIIQLLKKIQDDLEKR